MTSVAPLGDGDKVDPASISGTPQSAANPTPTKRVRVGGLRPWYTAPSTPKFEMLRKWEIVDKDNPLGDLTAIEPELLEAEVFQNGVPLLELLSMVSGSYMLTSPYAVLAKALSVAALDETETTVATGMDDGAMPLNLVFAIDGVSAKGKGSSMRTPLKCASDGCMPRIETPASGEALVEMFYERIMVDQPDGKGQKPEWVRREGQGVFAVWDEIDDFSAKTGIQATKSPASKNVTTSLTSRLRTMYVGGQVGDKAINRSDKPAYLEGKSYRVAVIIQGTPDRMGVLLNDDKGGLLQRTLIFHAQRDEDVSELDLDALEAMWYERRDAFCKRLGVPTQESCPQLDVWGPPSVEMLPEVKRHIVRGRLAHTYGRRDEVDGHLDSIRVRLAAIFAGWRAGYNQHAVIDEDAWWWACCVTERARRARVDLTDLTQRVRTDDLRGQGVDRAITKLAEDEAKANIAVKKTFPRTLERVSDLVDDIPRRASWNGKPRKIGTFPSYHDLKKGLTPSQVPFLDDAIQQHISENVIELFEDEGTVRYRKHPDAADRYSG